jgi:hypothetical protein
LNGLTGKQAFHHLFPLNALPKNTLSRSLAYPDWYYLALSLRCQNVTNVNFNFLNVVGEIAVYTSLVRSKEAFDEIQ